jgi:DNA invertase Pin-like site-specific DNA recombinase
MATGKFVAYYRVSTQRQGRSGLGLEAQRQAVADYLNGGRWKLVGEFTEVESGKRGVDRPVLDQALSACRIYNATLVIAKLDRLARNVEFTAKLMNSDIEFTAVDFPKANRLTIHILAAVAEHEREMISTRTREALAAAKKRSKGRLKLGGHPERLKRRMEGTRKSAIVRAEKAAKRAADLQPVIDALRSEGITSATAIAKTLNERGIAARRGGQWRTTQVSRLLARLQGGP